MKYFVFSDVHGDCNALMKAVKEYGYQPENSNHTLVSCGDNFGRADTGEGSKGIFDYLTSPIHKNPPVCLMGNHELILKDILFKRFLSVTDIANGEHKTVYSFLGMKPEEQELTAYDIDYVSRSNLMNWLLSRPYYFETDNYIFLHGFLPFDWESTQFITDNFDKVSEELWKNACWSQTPAMIDAFSTFYPDGIDKRIVFGHWHNQQLREVFEPIVDYENRHSIWKNEKLKLVGLDCCTVLSHRVEMLVVED
ncbi:MAG: metallophosphoesterase family protein [Candidatus Coproplasma sp.]